jgi:hypothetical protein
MAQRCLTTSSLFVILLATRVVAQQATPIPADISADSYDLYSVILKDVKVIAIDARANWEIGRVTKCVDPKSDEDREMLAKAEDLAKKDYIWEPKFKFGHEYRFVTKEEMNNKFCQPRSDGGCVPVLGGTETIYLLSVPSFNKDHARALVSIDAICGGLCGGGKFRVYRKTKDGWIGEDNSFAKCVWNY